MPRWIYACAGMTAVFIGGHEVFQRSRTAGKFVRLAEHAELRMIKGRLKYSGGLGHRYLKISRKPESSSLFGQYGFNQFHCAVVGQTLGHGAAERISVGNGGLRVGFDHD